MIARSGWVVVAVIPLRAALLLRTKSMCTKVDPEDEATFIQFVGVWRHYLQGWLRWNDEKFGDFVKEHRCTPTGVLFHEHAHYWVLPLLADRTVVQPPVDFYGNRSWASFGWNQLLGAIDCDNEFDEYNASDDEWLAARKRAEAVLAEYGTRLAIEKR